MRVRKYNAEELGVVTDIDKNMAEGRMALIISIKEVWYKCRNGHSWLDNTYYAVCPECGLKRDDAEYLCEEVYEEVLQELEEYREEKKQYMDKGYTEQDFIDKLVKEYMDKLVNEYNDYHSGETNKG